MRYLPRRFVTVPFLPPAPASFASWASSLKSRIVLDQVQCGADDSTDLR